MRSVNQDFRLHNRHDIVLLAYLCIFSKISSIPLDQICTGGIRRNSINSAPFRKPATLLLVFLQALSKSIKALSMLLSIFIEISKPPVNLYTRQNSYILKILRKRNTFVCFLIQSFFK